jgi:ribosomal protein S8
VGRLNFKETGGSLKMAQDLIPDALNQIMNAKKIEKKEVVITRNSKLLIKIFEIMKKYDYIDFKQEEGKVIVEIKKLNECKAIKPRFYVSVSKIDKYMRRYLPSRNFGFIIISTSKGLLTDEEAYKENLGGSLIAYCY